VNAGPIDDIVVRPRSTHRKRRSTSDLSPQRAPSQDRSRKRREAILDAAEELLKTANVEELSLSSVGAQADMSKAAVHYHFPTVAAIQLALGRRHDRAVWEIFADLNAKRKTMRVPTWQEWVRIEAGVARDYFNAHRPACETLLGPLLHRQTRLATMKDNHELGLAKLRNLCRVFEIPDQAILEQALPFNGEIFDVFWSGAYLKHGHIDDHSFEESVRASVGYLRSFLPEVLRMRADPAAPPASGTDEAA